MLDNKIEYEKMAEVEGSHWWYVSLHLHVIKIIKNHFPNQESIEILDAGCGTGGLLLSLKDNGFTNLCGFDISEYALGFCRKKNLNVHRLSLTNFTNFFSPESIQVVTCLDVLYFLSIEEQKKALADLFNLLKPGGLLILNLPALKIFSGIHDISVGIKKRYNHNMLIDILPGNILNAGYSYKYWPVIIAPLIAIARSLQRIKIRTGNFHIKSDVNTPSRYVNEVLKTMTNAELNFLPQINFGSSICIVSKKIIPDNI